MIVTQITPLYTLQLISCLVTALLALVLVLSRFQMRWFYHRYEQSRWIIFFAMLFLSLHFVLQMLLGIREESDEVGAVVNILFYTPVAIAVSYATFNVICFREGRRRYRLVSLCCYALILMVFLIGLLVYRSINIGWLLYVMLGLFLACMFFCVRTTAGEIRHHRKIMEEESASDLLPYDHYTWACYLLLTLSLLIFSGGIIFRYFLYLIAPLMLLTLFVFVMSFVGYGFYIVPMDITMHEEDEEDQKKAIGGAGPAETQNRSDALSDERAAVIRQRLEGWCEVGGFRDSTVNMATLSNRISIPRAELSQYFEQCLNSSFRVWLSDIRFKEAQRLLREKPHYNNDAISSECGFSSHAHLYKVFKLKTGLTPNQWKEKVFHS